MFFFSPQSHPRTFLRMSCPFLCDKSSGIFRHGMFRFIVISCSHVTISCLSSLACPLNVTIVVDKYRAVSKWLLWKPFIETLSCICTVTTLSHCWRTAIFEEIGVLHQGITPRLNRSQEITLKKKQNKKKASQWLCDSQERAIVLTESRHNMVNPTRTIKQHF